MYLANNTIFQTIVFPTSVVYPDPYVQDVRFDLRPELSQSGKGIAYLTDSSINNINGLLIVDLGTEEVWRHFDTPSVELSSRSLTHTSGVLRSCMLLQ